MRRSGAVLVVVAGLTAGMAVGTGPVGATTVSATIDGSTTFQTISGFGSSEGFTQARLLMGQPRAVQNEVLNLLYSKKSGAALSILRNFIGDISAYGTIEPTAPPNPSATPTYVPLGNDDGQEWLATTIKEKYGVGRIFADAASAPPFMKTNDSDSGGGTLCGEPGATCASGDWRQAYANYLVQYAKDYKAHGVPLEYIGFENEGNLATDYSSMIMTPAQTANFVDVLGPTLSNSRLPTQQECCATEGWNYAGPYSKAIEADPVASSYVKVFTSHGYTGAPASPLPGWVNPVWESEWSTFEGWDPAWDDGTEASGLSWAQNIYTGLTSANLSAFLYWWGADLFKGDNEGLVLVRGSTVSVAARLWAFANYSRFVRPGAVRIAATTADGQLEIAAFKDPNGATAITALNTATSPVTVAFSLTGRGVPHKGSARPYLTDSSSATAKQESVKVKAGTFSATIPGRALVTYDIRG